MYHSEYPQRGAEDNRGGNEEAKHKIHRDLAVVDLGATDGAMVSESSVMVLTMLLSSCPAVDSISQVDQDTMLIGIAGLPRERAAGFFEQSTEVPLGDGVTENATACQLTIIVGL
jgi:hypothetical protein